MSITPSQPDAAQTMDDHPGDEPWMDDAAFPVPPMPFSYGYQRDKAIRRCSQEKLIEHIQSDTSKKIALVWTPDSMHLSPPEAIPWLFEAVRAREYAFLKQARFYAILNTILWGVSVAMNAAISLSGHTGIGQIQIFNWLALGIIPLCDQSWNLYRLRFYTPEVMQRHIPDARYTAWLRCLKAPWTWALVICLSGVGIVQFVLSLWFFFDVAHSSIAAAGIVKLAIGAGEWWRLLTGTFLHASILHFLFNIVALFVLGKIIEVTFHRVYVPIVFVLCALSGSICSFILLPNTTSVGASGGIMGLLGFILVLGWAHRHHFPRTLQRGLLISVVYIAVAGLLASQVIDNPAHAGGFAIGVILGLLRIRQRPVRIPDQVSPLMFSAGIVASGIILATTLVALYKILAA